MKIFVYPSELQEMQRHFNSLITLAESEEKSTKREQIMKDAYDFLASYQKIYFTPKVPTSDYLKTGALLLPFVALAISTGEFQQNPEICALFTAVAFKYGPRIVDDPSAVIKQTVEDLKKNYREYKAGLTDVIQSAYHRRWPLSQTPVEKDISSIEHLRKKEDITLDYLIQRYEFILDNPQPSKNLTASCSIS